MNCRDAVRAVHARLDNQALDISEKALDAHLATCARCRTEAARLDEITGLLNASAVRMQAPAGMADQIWTAVLEKRAPEIERRAPRSGWLIGRHALIGAATAFAALLVGGFFFRPTSSPHANPPVAKHPGASHQEFAKNTPPAVITPAPKAATPTRGTVRPMPKPAVAPRYHRKRPIIYYANRILPEPTANRRPPVENRTPVLSRGTAKEYERIAGNLVAAQEIQARANMQVREELDKTAGVLSRSFEMIERTMEKPSSSQTAPTGAEGAGSPRHEALGG